MRRYETTVILDPDLSEDQRVPFFDKLKDIISQKDGFLVMIDEWGTQKLAYEIRKKLRGFYFRADYCGTGELVDEMERSFKIDDKVLKYMTILLEKQTDVEKLKAEIAAAQAETESPAESASADAETVPETTSDTEEAAPASDAAEAASPADEAAEPVAEEAGNTAEETTSEDAAAPQEDTAEPRTEEEKA